MHRRVVAKPMQSAVRKPTPRHHEHPREWIRCAGIVLKRALCSVPSLSLQFYHAGFRPAYRPPFPIHDSSSCTVSGAPPPAERRDLVDGYMMQRARCTLKQTAPCTQGNARHARCRRPPAITSPTHLAHSRATRPLHDASRAVRVKRDYFWKGGGQPSDHTVHCSLVTEAHCFYCRP